MKSFSTLTIIVALVLATTLSSCTCRSSKSDDAASTAGTVATEVTEKETDSSEDPNDLAVQHRSLAMLDPEIVATAELETAIPEDFPKDVPVFPDLKLEKVMKTLGDGYFVRGATDKPLNEIITYFEQSCNANGWSEIMSVPKMMNTSMFEYAKDKRTLMLEIVTQGDQATVTVSTR